MKEKKVNREELKKELLKTIGNLEKDNDIKKMIKNNRIHFKVKDIDYQVRKPDYSEQTEIETFRRKKYLDLVKDKDMLFKKQWIEIYAKKGIDIVKMEADIIKLQNEIDALLLRLATASNDKDVSTLKAQIVNLKDEQAGINIEKTDLLSYCIEEQLTIHATSYYTYAVLEKKEGDKMVKVFNSYENFAKCKDTELINNSFYYINYIIYTLPV